MKWQICFLAPFSHKSLHPPKHFYISVYLYICEFLSPSTSVVTWQEQITDQTTTQTDAWQLVTHPSLSWTIPESYSTLAFLGEKRSTDKQRMRDRISTRLCVSAQFWNNVTLPRVRGPGCSPSDSAHSDEVTITLFGFSDAKPGYETGASCGKHSYD